MTEFFDTEYPQLDAKTREFVAETIRKVCKKLPDEEIIQRGRAFINNVLGG